MLDSRVKFDEKMDNCLYFNVPREFFSDVEIEDDMCELSVDIRGNLGVVVEIKIKDCDWKEVQIPQDEIIELLKMALKEV